MTEEAPEPIIVTVGTEAEIIEVLSWCRARLNPLAVAIAQRQVREGNRAVELDGERYEIRDPNWTLEQDIYGCEEGRGCPDVTAAERIRLEAIIAARLEDTG